MEYKYTIIYRFEGIAGSNFDNDKILYQNTSQGITVVLTNDVNRHCLVLDTGLACTGLLFRGIFSDKKIHEVPIEIDAELKKIQEERVSKNKNCAYAVIIINGHKELDIKEDDQIDTGKFRVCFDSVDKELLIERHKETVQSIVSSLSISTGPEYYAEKISSGLYFIDSNNKPLYVFSIKCGRPRLICANQINTEKEQEISEIIGLSIGNQQLKTPLRLLTQSLETTQDELRAFVFAWSALEILTNKIFSTYEEKFISNIESVHNSHGVNQFLMRIKEVMKDKYRLTDKFSLIASFLSNESDKITEDIESFKNMKKMRDSIFHGEEFDEETLPVENARRLVAKYLMAHMLSTKMA